MKSFVEKLQILSIIYLINKGMTYGKKTIIGYNTSNNSELYLKSALDSIVNQTVFNELEIILINDGSTDQSQYICQEYCNRYDNIFLYNQENLGVSKQGITV